MAFNKKQFKKQQIKKIFDGFIKDGEVDRITFTQTIFQVNMIRVEANGVIIEVNHPGYSKLKELVDITKTFDIEKYDFNVYTEFEKRTLLLLIK
ncbi:MAG: hypothetical protein DRG78_15395 [Epsilonproteobacteria bacterium]|nr:MAG: hypothetical protein DRG78_15395 [Campylobacterota bacterium]